jgi:predicted Zn-dependent protease
MNKRLAMLEQLTASGQGDAFAWYALALEYRRESRAEDALAAFASLRGKFPDYLPMYLMAGQILIELGRGSDARGWLEPGIALARTKGDAKALGELEAALAET